MGVVARHPYVASLDDDPTGFLVYTLVADSASVAWRPLLICGRSPGGPVDAQGSYFGRDSAELPLSPIPMPFV